MQTLNDHQISMPIAELIETSKIHLDVLPDSQSLHKNFARTIADEIKTNNQAGHPTRLILPVGPILQYPMLVDICNKERISWRQVYTFNMDDYCDWQGRPLPNDHPLSFAGFMHRVVFDRLDDELRIPSNQIFFPNPMHLDRISEEIARVGGIDTCYGGIGYHGHVAFNEPPVSRWFSPSIEEFRNSLTRVVPLAPDSVIMNSIRNIGGDSTHFPLMGVTLGMRDILSAKRLRMYCPGGAWQRHIVRMACFGDEDVDYPVTLMQDPPDYILVTDEQTATAPMPSLGL